MPTLDQAGAVLTIDLGAIVANWRLLAGRLSAGRECAAVVKADAYGLGADQVAPALAAAGCRTFCVAHVEEGIRLRQVLPNAAILVFHGPLPATEADFVAHRLTPMLNSPDQIERWGRHAARIGGEPLEAALHVDTGMARLGLSPSEAEAVANDPGRLAGIRLILLASHLACADTPAHPLNQAQLQAFLAFTARFPGVRTSLANSSGIFLGPEWHFDLARPGAALYGVNPTPESPNPHWPTPNWPTPHWPGPGRPNPMAHVVRLEGKIIQVRDVDTSQTVGYAASRRVGHKGRIATVAVGYADGYLRCLGNSGLGNSGRGGFLGNIRVPLVGRVSMDLVTFDVSAAPEDAARPGAMIEMIGPHRPVDALAAEAGTIGYEILTSLGPRYHRRYEGEALDRA